MAKNKVNLNKAEDEEIIEQDEVVFEEEEVSGPSDNEGSAEGGNASFM